MTLILIGLLCVLVASVAVGVVPLLPGGARRAVSGALTCLAGMGGVLAGAAALAGARYSASTDALLPLSRATVEIDALSGLFMAMIGAVAVAAGIYSVGYTHSPHDHDTRDAPPGASAPAAGTDSRWATACLPLFVAAMLLVPAAGNVTTFLVGWELMAVASLVLVLAEHRDRPQVRQAGVWYAAMTHAGFAVILIGLVLLAARSGTETFAGIRADAPDLAAHVRSTVFVLTLVGFASKAGLVPLHVWLPRAHPEAPSYVSALMSAAMVNLGLYGIVRVWFDLLGGGPRWWGLVLLVLGAVSALYGVLQAAVTSDLKRLLGYSTTENLGLVCVGVGAAGMLAAAGNRTLAGLLLVAALLHSVNHAGFKTLLFLGAGAVLRATGLRDLDRMGGLAQRMPVTAALTGIGALAASGLPPGNGFVSEWLLLQGLIHSLPPAGAPDVVLAVTMPLAVGAVALTAGLGVATFVKAWGVGFLARPRSDEAAAAREGTAPLWAGMALAAAACAVLALWPAGAIRALSPVLAALPSFGSAAPVQGDAVVTLSGVTGSMSPVLIAAALAVGLGAVAVGLRLLATRRRRRALVWGCGGTRLSPRMQYTATSFAEPLIRVFDDVLQPEQGVDVTHYEESRYLVASVEYRHRVPDRIEARLYPPVLAAANWWAQRSRRLQNGSLHRYLAYGLIGVILVLVFAAVMGS
jgi:formate hydrogenlyase subunit 3/multisubunit Na+/H+ antiporter MnhD subunit